MICLKFFPKLDPGVSQNKRTHKIEATENLENFSHQKSIDYVFKTIKN